MWDSTLCYEAYSVIERCFNRHWKNWLHYFRRKISILLRKTANSRFCLWRRKTTFKYSESHQDLELIFLSKRCRRSWIIKICVFYRIFIANFTFIVQSIYTFLKKNVSFVWKLAQQKVMNISKIIFINSSAFIFIDYEIDVVILAMNANLEDWRKILMILRNEKKTFDTL